MSPRVVELEGSRGGVAGESREQDVKVREPGDGAANIPLPFALSWGKAKTSKSWDAAFQEPARVRELRADDRLAVKVKQYKPFRNVRGNAQPPPRETDEEFADRVKRSLAIPA